MIRETTEQHLIDVRDCCDTVREHVREVCPYEEANVVARVMGDLMDEAFYSDVLYDGYYSLCQDTEAIRESLLAREDFPSDDYTSDEIAEIVDQAVEAFDKWYFD